MSGHVKIPIQTVRCGCTQSVTEAKRDFILIFFNQKNDLLKSKTHLKTPKSKGQMPFVPQPLTASKVNELGS